MGWQSLWLLLLVVAPLRFAVLGMGFQGSGSRKSAWRRMVELLSRNSLVLTVMVRRWWLRLGKHSSGSWTSIAKE